MRRDTTRCSESGTVCPITRLVVTIAALHDCGCCIFKPSYSHVTVEYTSNKTLLLGNKTLLLGYATRWPSQTWPGDAVADLSQSARMQASVSVIYSVCVSRTFCHRRWGLRPNAFSLTIQSEYKEPEVKMDK